MFQLLTGVWGAAEVHGAQPPEGRLPASLLSDRILLDEVQAGQHVGDVIEAPHLS